MANRITQEQIEQINELYLIYGVKSRVAKEVGVSAASVTKYLIDGYVSKNGRVELDCEVEPNFDGLFLWFQNGGEYDKIKELSPIEEKDLKKLQKEIF